MYESCHDLRSFSAAFKTERKGEEAPVVSGAGLWVGRRTMALEIARFTMS